MMNDDLVSIITPAFNASRFISETMDSVINQTYKNWEMIIVDDCSKDTTIELVTKYASRDPRIKLIRQQVNSGPALARDVAIQSSKGRFIAFVDSDDIWLPHKLEKQIAFMKDNKAAVSFTQFKRMTEDGTSFGETLKIPDSLTASQMLKNTAMGTSTVIIDREMVGPFRMTNAPCDDLYLWIEILNRGFVAKGMQEETVWYRVVSSSFSRNKFKYVTKVWKTYRLMGLGFFYSAWCFANYAARAWLKYRKF